MGCAGGGGARTSLLAIYPIKGGVNILVRRPYINCAIAFTMHAVPAIIQRAIIHRSLR